MNKNLVVETDNLTKTFLGKEVIKGCNMHVETGMIYGFLGANGAGKTTVFKMLSGLLTPTMGKARILGMDIISQRGGILSEIGTIIETPIFYEHLSATENLEIHLAYMGKDNSDIVSALAKVGLNDTGSQPVSTFSLGMRQRLAIARAIIHKPKLLILDEPINGLDPIGIREMRDFFIELVKTQGVTILISSHILSEIEHLADIIGVIVNGTIVSEVSMTKVKAEYPSGLEAYFMDIMNGRRGHENTN
ncbi:ABC-2 type transport system ATP-binding protein [Kineothrix alysoides]|uniref:ABC-2 type transport system ATP-binding protein n=1 Tax=Kineothrix alysoides TaxID=1469948 RepID=A0A4R1QS68_9FIRM|nr:ATP-binding cassette domain-containing protein [Kineothrix alysoides]TCL56297.1 ABC-2 type transport system ATP-binding protein [Kineothrix alysoides]